jgi:hypothetical protein
MVMRPEVVLLASDSDKCPGAPSAHTFGGMSVERHRRVTKLILISSGRQVSELSIATITSG